MQRKDTEKVNREEGKEKKKMYHKNIRVKRKQKNWKGGERKVKE